MIFLLSGISGCGKTVWAKEYLKNNPNTVIISRDVLREKYFPCGYKRVLSFQDEERITSIQRKEVVKAIALKKDIIIDDTNLRQSYLKEWISIFINYNVKWEIKIFDISLDEAIKRNQLREDKVSEDVIRKQYQIFKSNKEAIRKMNDNVFSKPHPKDIYVQIPHIDIPIVNVIPYNKNNNLPKAVIVDIDGTVALTGDRNIYDYMMVEVDIPREDVIEVVKSLKNSGISIIIFSGRKIQAKEKTIEWLKNNQIPFDEIYLRNEEESEKNYSDTIAKYRMFNEVRNKYNFIGAIDDRPKVTRLYQDLGLTTFFVGEYGREF